MDKIWADTEVERGVKWSVIKALTFYWPLMVFIVCQVYICGGPFHDIQNNTQRLQESRCTKKIRSMCTWLSSVFTDLSMSFVSVNDILSSAPYRRDSGGLALRDWDRRAEINPLPTAHCCTGQQQVTSSVVWKQIFAKQAVSFDLRDSNTTLTLLRALLYLTSTETVHLSRIKNTSVSVPKSLLNRNIIFLCTKSILGICMLVEYNS